MKSKLILIVLAFMTICMFNYENMIPTSFKQPTAYKLLELHNKERTSRGYKSLVLDKRLCDYAQKHAKFMSENNDLVHSKMSELNKVNKDSSVVGENIAWGQETEESVMNSWMWSPGHRWNILGSNYKRIGVGIQKDKNNKIYWCVVFSN